MLNFQAFELFNRRAIEQRSQAKNIPVAVAEIMKMSPLALLTAGLEQLVKCSIGSLDAKVGVDKHQGIGNSVDDRLCELTFFDCAIKILAKLCHVCQGEHGTIDLL